MNILKIIELFLFQSHLTLPCGCW